MVHGIIVCTGLSSCGLIPATDGLLFRCHFSLIGSVTTLIDALQTKVDLKLLTMSGK